MAKVIIGAEVKVDYVIRIMLAKKITGRSEERRVGKELLRLV